VSWITREKARGADALERGARLLGLGVKFEEDLGGVEVGAGHGSDAAVEDVAKVGEGGLWTRARSRQLTSGTSPRTGTHPDVLGRRPVDEVLDDDEGALGRGEGGLLVLSSGGDGAPDAAAVDGRRGCRRDGRRGSLPGLSGGRVLGLSRETEASEEGG
jgi:hypothetical protein